MTRLTCLGIVVLVAMCFSSASVPQAAASSAQAAPPEATAAAKANPELVGALGATSSTLSQLGSGASGLAGAASVFSKLGLSSDMVGKAVPVLTSYVTKSGGSKAGSLLAGALK
jgi:Protein of unknown function VcgC/VcgE (DUF2780)